MRYTYKWLVCVSAHPRCWTRQFQASMGTYSREYGSRIQSLVFRCYKCSLTFLCFFLFGLGSESEQWGERSLTLFWSDQGEGDWCRWLSLWVFSFDGLSSSDNTDFEWVLLRFLCLCSLLSRSFSQSLPHSFSFSLTFSSLLSSQVSITGGRENWSDWLWRDALSSPWTEQHLLSFPHHHLIQLVLQGK